MQLRTKYSVSGVEPQELDLRPQHFDNFEGFWDKAARELPWLKTWDRVFEADYPSFKWFVGGQTNLSFSCVDHHVASGRAGHAAIIYANELGARSTLTYAQLKREVEKTAAGLRGLGLGKGDRLTIYMPNCLEAVVLMLATVRIGAIHSVVFAGFSAPALADRVRASGSRAIFTADVAYRKGGVVRLKEIVDATMALGCEDVEHVVTLQREADAPALDGRLDVDWGAFIAGGQGHNWNKAIAMATPIAHKGATQGALAQSMTLLDFMVRPDLVEAAWDYFRDVQTADLQYTPFIRPTDQPAIEMNAGILDEFRERMRPFYYNPDQHDSYLDQLGVSYPTLRQPDGRCTIGSVSCRPLASRAAAILPMRSTPIRNTFVPGSRAMRSQSSALSSLSGSSWPVMTVKLEQCSRWVSGMPA